jgi:hypothetical protein
LVNVSAAALGRTFGDGESNTILFMEKFASCDIGTSARGTNWALTPVEDPAGGGAHGWGDYLVGFDAKTGAWDLPSTTSTNGYNSNNVPVQLSLLVPQYGPTSGNASCENPQGFTVAGIGVVMGEVNTRVVAGGIDQTTWALLLLPNDGQVIRGEW